MKSVGVRQLPKNMQGVGGEEEPSKEGEEGHQRDERETTREDLWKPVSNTFEGGHSHELWRSQVKWLAIRYWLLMKFLTRERLTPVALGQWFSTLNMHQNHPEGLFLGMAPRASGSVGPGQGLRMCISSTFAGDADASVPGHTVRTTALGAALLREVRQQGHFLGSHLVT